MRIGRNRQPSCGCVGASARAVSDSPNTSTNKRHIPHESRRKLAPIGFEEFGFALAPLAAEHQSTSPRSFPWLAQPARYNVFRSNFDLFALTRKILQLLLINPWLRAGNWKPAKPKREEAHFAQI